MQCPKCGASIQPNQKFCTKCGEKIVAEPQPQVTKTTNVCPSCGAPLSPGQKFCTKCGAKIAVQQPQQGNDKGIIDNIRHFGTFLQHGSSGVQQEIRHEEQQRLRQQAQAMGMEVVEPQSGRQAPQQTQHHRLTVDTNSIEGVSLVSGRAIWEIQKGQIARLITEIEFANAEGLKGVIVQEGCTAMVFIDGQLMSLMQAGCYTFPAKTPAERQLDQRQRELDAEAKEHALEEEQRKQDKADVDTFARRGVFGQIAAFGHGVMNFLFGKKKEDNLTQHRQRVERTRQKLQKNPAPKVCRVYIVSNRVINLLFGSQLNTDGIVDFAPLLIPTKLVDVNIAVSMQLQISNMNIFVANYLADKNSVTVLDIQNELATGVKATLTQILRNLDYQQDGLPEPIINNLKNRLLTSCNERLQGIEVVRVMDITDSSADFDRFRAVERELFASEKELGFLQRTNEFRNRLEQEENKRTVDAAVNAEQLRQSLQAINKDKLLSEDEMEQFVMLLESQKRLREATTKEEEYEALLALKKNRLVKDDDIAALENVLAQGKIDRENVTEIMRIQASQKVSMAQQIAEFELSDSKVEHDMANALRQAQHQGNLAAVQLDTKRLMDAYNDERNEFDWNRAFSRRQQEDDYDWQKQQREQQANNQQALFDQQLREQQTQAEHGRLRQDKFDDMDILERKAAIAKANMQAMKDAELRELQELNRSAENIHSMDVQEQINRDNIEANMSAEQLMAKRASQLDAGAQAAFANALGSGRENELLQKQQAEQKALYEQMIAQQNAQNSQNQEWMMKMAQMMQQGMLGAAGAQMANQQQQYAQQQAFQQQRYDDQVQMKQEYQQQAQYAQQRQEHAQDQAFGAMSGVATAAASNLGAFNGGFNGSAQQTAAMQQPAPQQPQGRICPACGADVPEGEMFCGECGQKM